MKVFTRLLMLAVMIPLLGLINVSQALAQTPELSYLRVAEPLNVGGTILQPDTYVIKVLQHFTDRDVLQVMSQDQLKVFVTVLSIPHVLPPTEQEKNNVFVYFPAVNGAPRALRTWFAPQAVTEGGHDIVYLRHHAMQLASVANIPVVAASDETTTEQLNTTPLVVVNPDQNVTAYVAPVPSMTSSSTATDVPATTTTEAAATTTTEATATTTHRHHHHMHKD